MGYCGLGMQRWIYNQKTRKMFAGRTKSDSAGNTVNSDHLEKILNSKAKYKKLVDHKKLTPEYKELLLSHIKHDRKIYRQKVIIMVLLTLLIVVPIGYFFYDLNKPLKDSKVRQITKEFLSPNGSVKTSIIYSNNGELFAIEQYFNDSLVLKESLVETDSIGKHN